MRSSTQNRTVRIAARAAVLVLMLIASGCSGADPAPPETVVVTSIVEVPGDTQVVTTIVTDIIEVIQTTTLDPKAGWPSTLVFGIPIAGLTEPLQDSFQAFSEAMSEALGIRVVTAIRPDEETLTADIGNATVDVGSLTPVAYVATADAVENVELLAQSVRFGDKTYHSQWFTNDPAVCGADPIEGSFYYDESGEVIAVGPTESPALQVGWTVDGSRDDSVDAGLACPAPVDLSVVVGKTIAFTTETSAIGFIFPALQLRQEGIDKDQYESILTGGHDHAVSAVYDGIADIGVSFNDARRTGQAADVGSKVIVFNITPRAANDVLAIRADLPPSLKEALFDALVAYIRTPEGQPVMFDVFGWTDLDRADDVTAASLQTVAAAMQELGFTG